MKELDLSPHQKNQFSLLYLSQEIRQPSSCGYALWDYHLLGPMQKMFWLLSQVSLGVKQMFNSDKVVSWRVQKKIHLSSNEPCTETVTWALPRK